MTTTFDTLQYAKKLQELGFSREQAEGLADLQKNIVAESLATKADLQELKYELLKWMFGIAAGQVALIVALFAFIK